MNLNFSFFCHNIQIMSSFSSSSSPATGSATSGSGSINHNKRRRVWNNDSDEDHDEDDDADPREEECYCYGLRMPSWHHDGKFCVRADLLLLITKMVAVALCESELRPFRTIKQAIQWVAVDEALQKFEHPFCYSFPWFHLHYFILLFFLVISRHVSHQTEQLSHYRQTNSFFGHGFQESEECHH